MKEITLEPALVLDACQRNALAAVRSLGQQGVPVFAADASPASLAGSSRYCRSHIALPSPISGPDSYVAAVARAVRETGAGVVFPMTDTSLMLLAPRAGDLGVRLAGPSVEAYEVLTDKGRLVELALGEGIPVPHTVAAENPDVLLEAADSIGYPCVLKPARSKLLTGGRIIATNVKIARDRADAESVARAGWLGAMPCLVQAFVPGRGAGVFSLYGPAGPLAWFAHRRLREKPPTGGVSVLCESAPVDADLKDQAGRLLSAADWFGPAMVEFRVDPSGRAWLMEVNGRFWGSLQLSIDAGVNFPWLLYRLCTDNQVAPVEAYRVGRRLRWLLGDLDHLLIQLRGNGTAASAAEKLSAAGAFLRPSGGSTRLEILRRNDLAPFRYELRRWFATLGGEE